MFNCGGFFWVAGRKLVSRHEFSHGLGGAAAVYQPGGAAQGRGRGSAAGASRPTGTSNSYPLSATTTATPPRWILSTTAPFPLTCLSPGTTPVSHYSGIHTPFPPNLASPLAEPGPTKGRYPCSRGEQSGIPTSSRARTNVNQAAGYTTGKVRAPFVYIGALPWRSTGSLKKTGFPWNRKTDGGGGGGGGRYPPPASADMQAAVSQGASHHSLPTAQSRIKSHEAILSSSERQHATVLRLAQVKKHVRQRGVQEALHLS